MKRKEKVHECEWTNYGVQQQHQFGNPLASGFGALEIRERFILLFCLVCHSIKKINF